MAGAAREPRFEVGGEAAQGHVDDDEDDRRDEQGLQRVVEDLADSAGGGDELVVGDDEAQRGVADDVVKDAVGELTPDDELAAARELVRRRAPAMRGDDPARRTRRLAGMLARKGYSGAVAMRAIREELATADDDAESYLAGDPDEG